MSKFSDLAGGWKRVVKLEANRHRRAAPAGDWLATQASDRRCDRPSTSGGRRRLGEAPAEAFAARQLRSSMISSANLVPGVSIGHRSAVVQRHPEALVTTFGLREFARPARPVNPAALPVDPVARAHALIEEVRLLSGWLSPTSRVTTGYPKRVVDTS